MVANEYTQKERIDDFYTNAPVARITSIRLLFASASINKLNVHQIYVKTSFLNGELTEELYIEQHEGFVLPRNKHIVSKLVKSLYGLK